MGPEDVPMRQEETEGEGHREERAVYPYKTVKAARPLDGMEDVVLWFL